FEYRVVVVVEEVPSAVVAVAEGPHQERRHLTPRDEVVGAEQVVGGWVAAAGDACGAEAVDVSFEDVAVVVVEEVASAVVAVAEGPHQERRHLASADTVLGAELRVGRWVAAPCDPLLGQPADVVFEHIRRVDVREVVGALARRWRGGSSRTFYVDDVEVGATVVAWIEAFLGVKDDEPAVTRDRCLVAEAPAAPDR